MESQKGFEKHPKQEWAIVQDDEDGVLQIPTSEGMDKQKQVPWKKYWLDRSVFVPPSSFKPPTPPADWKDDKASWRRFAWREKLLKDTEAFEVNYASS